MALYALQVLSCPPIHLSKILDAYPNFFGLWQQAQNLSNYDQEVCGAVFCCFALNEETVSSD